jgi:hypothetical protein
MPQIIINNWNIVPIIKLLHYVTVEEEESEEERKNKSSYSSDDDGDNFEKMTNVVSAPKNLYFIFKCHAPS